MWRTSAEEYEAAGDGLLPGNRSGADLFWGMFFWVVYVVVGFFAIVVKQYGEGWMCFPPILLVDLFELQSSFTLGTVF